MENKKILKKQADTIRFLAADMVQRANSGHPGAPMGLADIVTVLARHITHNPKNPKWLNRDRLIFSGGHASALVYSFLHLCGYDLSIEDLQNFSKLIGQSLTKKTRSIWYPEAKLGKVGNLRYVQQK